MTFICLNIELRTQPLIILVVIAGTDKERQVSQLYEHPRVLCIPTLISLGIKVPPVGIPTTLEAKGCNIQNMSRRKVIYLCLYFPVLSIYVFTVIKCCSKCV